jgi:energy-coupling factor transporter ATP-binding protein EcfA2
MELLSEVHRQGNTVLMVTHNPELTRYANRVIYMHDGMIAGDERTALGDVAKGARKTYYKRTGFTSDEIAAGVSALMKQVPGKELASKPRRRKAKVTKRARRRKVKR